MFFFFHIFYKISKQSHIFLYGYQNLNFKLLNNIENECIA